jgi:trimethylamine--corrinoid protein Co-methyltransferase
MPLRPGLEVLSDDDFEMIHKATIRLLEDTGIVFHHDEVLRLFGDHRATVDGNLVRLPKTLIEDSIRLATSKFKWQARNDDRSVIMGEGPVVQPAAGPICINNLDRGRRPGMLQDYINLQKIYQAQDVFDLANKTCKEILTAAPDSLIDPALEEELEAYIKSHSE